MKLHGVVLLCICVALLTACGAAEPGQQPAPGPQAQAQPDDSEITTPEISLKKGQRVKVMLNGNTDDVFVIRFVSIERATNYTKYNIEIDGKIQPPMSDGGVITLAFEEGQVNLTGAWVLDINIGSVLLLEAPGRADVTFTILDQ